MNCEKPPVRCSLVSQMILEHVPTSNNNNYVCASIAAPACEEPPDIDFGGIVSDDKLEYREGDKVQYKCNPGYSLMGTEWITCSRKTWKPAPQCLGKGNCFFAFSHRLVLS